LIYLFEQVDADGGRSIAGTEGGTFRAAKTKAVGKSDATAETGPY